MKLYYLEAALASARAYQFTSGRRDWGEIEHLERQIEAAKNPTFQPVFGTPAAPVAPPTPPAPLPAAPPVQITFKGSWGIYAGPRPRFRERD